MAKNKNRIPKSLTSAFVIVVTASILLTSFTFAKFLSFSSTDASSSIADWNVTITPQTNDTEYSGYNGAISFGKLSPGTAKTLTDGDSGYLVQNSSKDVYLADFKYTTDVGVKLCISSSDFTIKFNDGSTLTSSGHTGEDSSVAAYVSGATESIIGKSISETVNSSHNYSTSNYTPTLSDIISLYELDFYVDSVADENKFSKDTNSGYDFYDFNSGSGSCSIYGTLSWQIYVEKYSSTGDYSWATYLCDWVGKYVDNVSCTLTYSARQASELPT